MIIIIATVIETIINANVIIIIIIIIIIVIINIITQNVNTHLSLRCSVRTVTSPFSFAWFVVFVSPYFYPVIVSTSSHLFPYGITSETTPLIKHNCLINQLASQYSLIQWSAVMAEY